MKVVNLLYDTIDLGNAARAGEEINEVKRITITDHFNWANIPFKIKKVDDSINFNDFNVYVIELFYVHDLEDLFKNIPVNTFNIIRKEKIKLLIYFPIEGFDLELYDNWFLKLHKLFEKYNLTEVKKYFIFNNLNIDNLYKEFLKKYKIRNGFDIVFGYPYFFFEYFNKFKKDQIIAISKSIKKKKDFLCLNSKIRPHRVVLAVELSRRKIDNNCFFSFVGSKRFHEETTIEFNKKFFQDSSRINEEHKKLFNDCLDYLDNWKPKVLDTESSKLDFFNLEEEWYKESYFSIVTETGLGSSLRFTEKVIKPLANGHPFIVIGCYDTLNYLRSLGFETFSEMFDESYDNEKVDSKRLSMAIDEIEKFCKLSKHEKMARFKKVQKKLIHNQELLFNKIDKKMVKEYRSMFKEIKEN